MTKATAQQQQAIASKANRLIVQAYAGAGKTFTLEELAQANPAARILYLAYSSAIQVEAQSKFPSNVECRTTHSLAWAFGHSFKAAGKLGDLRTNDLMRAFDLKVGFARILLTTIENFLCSADTDFAEQHVPASVAEKDVVNVIKWGQYVWQEMQDLDRMDVPMPHDGYLKLYQLANPDLSKRFDIILFDEAQDANPVTLDILTKQTCRVVMVGDKYQSIFAFRGAINAMERIEADELVYLTESRRFGQGIATIASQLLSTFRGEGHPVVSAFAEKETKFTIDADRPYAIIGRTNAKVFGAAVSMLGLKRIHFVGGIENYPFGKLVDVWHLMNNQRDRIVDPTFRTFETIADLEAYADGADDKEILSLIGVVKKFRDRIPALVEQIKKEAKENQDDADVVLTTAHRSKGLEFEQVSLLDDFQDLVTEDGQLLKVDTPELQQELNLLYVAITRAKDALQINLQLREVLSKLSDSSHEASPNLSVNDTEQARGEVGLLARFDYPKGICTCSVSDLSVEKEHGPVVLDERLASSVELAILRKGLLSVASLAEELALDPLQVTIVLVQMIRQGRLSERLFKDSPAVMARLQDTTEHVCQAVDVQC